MRLMITHASDLMAYKIQQKAKADFTVMIDEMDLPKLQTANLLMIGKAYKKAHLLHEVLKLAIEHDIDTIVPIDAEDLSLFEKNRLLFEEYQIQILPVQHWI